jgi:hypothetical protein
MEDFFDVSSDPLLGRGLGVVVAAPGVQCSTAGQTARTALQGVPRRILIAAAVTRSGDPVAAAHRELESAGAEAVHRAWWRDFWSRSQIRLSSPSGEAERLVNAYRIHLYTLASVNRGPFPAKWDGGPGLLVNDQRMVSEWVQDPLHLHRCMPPTRWRWPEDFRHHSGMPPYLRSDPEDVGTAGIWVPETVTMGTCRGLRAPRATATLQELASVAAGQRLTALRSSNCTSGFVRPALFRHHYLTYSVRGR